MLNTRAAVALVTSTNRQGSILPDCCKRRSLEGKSATNKALLFVTYHSFLPNDTHSILNTCKERRTIN